MTSVGGTGASGTPANPADGPLCARVRAAAATVRPALGPGRTADRVAAVVARLDEPSLRIAVGGRLNAGKSTLINALVGQRVAATAATECTLLVAWFRRSHQNRIEVRRTDGGSHVVRGRAGGGVPDDLGDLGVPREQIAELVVEVVNDRLADYSIVDTPGMDALSGLDAAAMAALGRADALLYVMPHPGQGDADALEALRRNASTSITAANVVGVLSRIDELGPGTGDPWPVARRIAERYSVRLNGLVATTVPVVGLLAQAALGDRYTEDDTRLIGRLAAAEPADLDDALYSADDFRAWDGGPLGVGERDRLLGLLGRYGIRTAVAAVCTGTTGTRGLLGVLRSESGIDDVTGAVRDRFVVVADRLRATAAIAALDEAVRWNEPGQPDEVLGALHTALAEIRRHPRLRQSELNAALADMAAHRLDLAEPDLAALLALATGTEFATCLGLAPGAAPAAVAAAAETQIRRWRTLEDRPPRTTQRHARTAREVCEALYFAAARPTA